MDMNQDRYLSLLKLCYDLSLIDTKYRFSILDNKNKAYIMKQRCWKQLRNQLCPTEKWVKDNEHSKCQCCSKEFLLLVRRRHHCRFCGNLFCAECSDYFINGNYIGETKEKYIRHCQFCHKKIQKFIREWTKMPQIYQQKNAQKNSAEQQLSQDDQDEKQFNLNKIFEQAEKTTSEFNQILGEKQMKILAEAAQALCDKFNLDKDVWKQKIKDLAQKAANETKMQVLVSQGSTESGMDIARRVKVKTILTEGNKAIQALVKGIVLQKNTSTKSMKSHLSHPKILIVQNSIDLDSLASFIKFEELIKNDKAIMKKILEKIIKLNPDIIFVQNNVHVFVLEYLQSKEIVVVNKLKPKQIQMIKQVTGIKKTIKKLWMLEKYKHQCIIGKCDKIYFKNAKEGQMLMFIEAADMGIRTILIGQQSEDYTNNLKKSIQILMRLARQLNLQKHFILVQKQIKDRIAKKQSILPIIEDFTSEIYCNVESFLINQQICFSKIYYAPIKLAQSPKNFQEYAHRVGKASSKQICGKIEFLTKKIYSNSDCTLGAYILMAAAGFERPCKKCQNNHKEQYYLQDYVITIQAEKKSSTVQKSLATVSNFNQMGNQEQQFTLEKLKNHLNKQKQLIVISTYAQCELCGNNVGIDSVKVGKLFLSNSFHHILHNLVIAYQTTVKLLDQSSKDNDSFTQGAASRKLSRRKLSIDKCEHSILTRVYQYTGIQIKITIDQAKIFYTDYIDLLRKQSLEHMRVKQNKFVKIMYEYELNQKMKLLEKLLGQLSALPFPNMSPTMSMSPNPKIMASFESSMRLRDILEKCRIQIKQIQTKSFEQLQKTKHDWTILTRRILKVQSILQQIFLIIDEIQRNLRKKKNEQNQQNLQNSVALQNYQPPHANEVEQGDISVMHTNNTIVSQTYLDQETKQYLKKKSTKVFPRVQGTYFHFHTANITDPVSLLACGINSSEFRRICEEEINNNPAQFTFRMNVYKRLKTDWALRVETDRIYNQIVGQITEKMQAIDITVYYPKQFQIFRKKQGIDNQLYTRGLCTSKSWDSSGGKSNSYFAKAQNDLLVVKVINEKQFDQFLKFAKDYIQYMKSSKVVGRDTLLAKIFGIYQVSAKGRNYKCIVMQNIFFGLSYINKVYDLKGSQVNRLSMPQGTKSSTGQDTNFKIDKEGQPYVLKAQQYDRIIKILEDDANFLKEHAVIDYSLLVIESKDSLRLGIIDYMRPYQLMEKIETFYKQFKSGRDPTVIPPNSYGERFITAMKRYFLKMQ